MAVLISVFLYSFILDIRKRHKLVSFNHDKVKYILTFVGFGKMTLVFLGSTLIRIKVAVC